MNYSKMLNKEFKRNNIDIRVTKVSAEKKPTADSLKILNREIAAQISMNDAMRSRSVRKV